MKLISLNTYMGHIFEPLMSFVEEQASSTDVFCFQEMMSSEDPGLVHTAGTRRLNLLQEIGRRLPDHAVAFEGTQDDFETTPSYPGQSVLGIATFYRKTLDVRETGSFFLCHSFNSFVAPDFATLAHKALHLVVREKGQEYLICNVHGNSQPPNKLDSSFRLSQFEKVRDFLKTRSEHLILMGDFNALPDTRSVKMFEDMGLRNLIREYRIPTTRGSHMRALFPAYADGPYGFQEFADYTFMSPEIPVIAFEVPDLPISDHLPMMLTIDAS